VLAEHLIGNLDEDGYLRRELEQIENDLAFTANISTDTPELGRVLKLVQSLDPAGVGARDLRECLLLQLERMPNAVDVLTAKAIVDKHFDAFTKKHYERIMERLEIDEDALKGCHRRDRSLNPRPGQHRARFLANPRRRSCRTSS
jgi:RNA polymerase sigma-54 factor